MDEISNIFLNQAQQAAQANESRVKSQNLTIEKLTQNLDPFAIKPDAPLNLNALPQVSADQQVVRTLNLNSPTWVRMNSSIEGATITNSDPVKMGWWARTVDGFTTNPDDQANAGVANSYSRGMVNGVGKALSPTLARGALAITDAYSQDPYYQWLTSEEALDTLGADTRDLLIAQTKASRGLDENGVNQERARQILASDVVREAAQEQANFTDLAAQYPKSEEWEKISQLQGTDLMKAILTHPGLVATEGLPELAVGSAVPAALGIAPALAGAPVASILLPTLQAGTSDWMTEFYERLGEKVDLSNPEAIANFAANPEAAKFITEASQKAQAHATPTALLTALSFRYMDNSVTTMLRGADDFLTRSRGTLLKYNGDTNALIPLAGLVRHLRTLADEDKLIGKPILNTLSQLGVQGTLGATGEAAGQLAADNEITDPYAVAANFFGEALTSPFDLVAGRMRANSQLGRTLVRSAKNMQGMIQKAEIEKGMTPEQRAYAGQFDSNIYVLSPSLSQKILERGLVSDPALQARFEEAVAKGEDIELKGLEFDSNISASLDEEDFASVGIIGEKGFVPSTEDAKLACVNAQEAAQTAMQAVTEGRDPEKAVVYPEDKSLAQSEVPVRSEQPVAEPPAQNPQEAAAELARQSQAEANAGEGRVVQTEEGDVAYVAPSGEVIRGATAAKRPSVAGEDGLAEWAARRLEKRLRKDRKEARKDFMQIMGEDLTKIRQGMFKEQKSNLKVVVGQIFDSIYEFTGLPADLLRRKYGNNFRFLGSQNARIREVKGPDGVITHDLEVLVPISDGEQKLYVKHNVPADFMAKNRGQKISTPYGTALLKFDLGDQSTFYHEFAHAFFDLYMDLGDDIQKGTYEAPNAAFFLNDKAKAKTWLNALDNFPVVKDEKGKPVTGEALEKIKEEVSKRAISPDFLPFNTLDFLKSRNDLVSWLRSEVGESVWPQGMSWEQVKADPKRYTEVQEKFAKAFEEALLQGIEPSKAAIFRVFDNIKTGMLAVYHGGLVPGGATIPAEIIDRIVLGRKVVAQASQALPILNPQLLQKGKNGSMAWDGISREQAAILQNNNSAVLAEARFRIEQQRIKGNDLLAAVNKALERDVRQGTADYVIKAKAGLEADMKAALKNNKASPIKGLSTKVYRAHQLLTGANHRYYLSKDSLAGLLTPAEIKSLDQAGALWNGEITKQKIAAGDLKKDSTGKPQVLTAEMLSTGLDAKNAKDLLKQIAALTKTTTYTATDAAGNKVKRTRSGLDRLVDAAVLERLRHNTPVRQQIENSVSASEDAALYGQNRADQIANVMDTFATLHRLSVRGMKERLRIQAMLMVRRYSTQELQHMISVWGRQAQQAENRALEAYKTTGDPQAIVAYSRQALQMNLCIDEARKAQVLARKYRRDMRRFMKKDVPGVSGEALTMMRQILARLGVAYIEPKAKQGKNKSPITAEERQRANEKKLSVNPSVAEIQAREDAWNKAFQGDRAALATALKKQVDEGEINEGQTFELLGMRQPSSMGEADVVSKLRSLSDPTSPDRPTGATPSFPERFLQALASGDTKYATTISGLMDVMNCIQTLKTLDGNKRNIQLVDGNKLDKDVAIEDIRGEMEGTAKNRGKEIPDTVPQDTVANELARSGKSWLSSLTRPIALLEQLAGKRDGFLYKYVIAPLMKSDNLAETLKNKYSKKIVDIVKTVKSTLRDTAIRDSSVEFFDGKFSRKQAFFMALNLGNLGNRQRLLDGLSTDAHSVTMAELMTFLGENLTDADWRAVQAIWDVFTELQPRLDRVMRRLTGQVPLWVQPEALTVVANGKALVLRGGYFPIRYDPRKSSIGSRLDSPESMQGMNPPAYGGSVIPGMMKERAKEVGKGEMLLLTEDSLFRGINDTIHFVSYAQWVADATKIFDPNKAVAKTIKNYYGEEKYQVIRNWIDAIKTGGFTKRGIMGNEVPEALARNISAMSLGFRVSTALIQITGAVQSMTVLGPSAFLHGVSTLMSGNGLLANIRYINAVSPAMRNRSQTQFREVATSTKLTLSRWTKAQNAMVNAAFRPLQWVQATVDYSTWMGAFEKIKREHPEWSNKEQVLYADRIVNDAQGSGRLSELSGIERNGGLWRVMLSFYSFFNASYNLINTQLAMDGHGRMRKFADVFAIVVIQSALAAMVKDALSGQDSQDEDWQDKALDYAVKEPAMFYLGLFPFARDLSGAFEDYNYSGPSGLRILKTSSNLIVRGKGALNNPDAEFFNAATGKDVIDLFGYGFGVPSTAIKQAYTGGLALYEGKTDNYMAVLTGYKPPK